MSGPGRELFRFGENVIGTWHCRPDDPEFGGGWLDSPHIAFPRTSVVIIQEGHNPVATDPNLIVVYRGNQEYKRQALDPAGDICEWFQFDQDWLCDALGERADDFWKAAARTHVTASSQVYLLQRRLTRFVSKETDPDPLLVEETLVRVLDLAVGTTFGAPESPWTRRSDSAHRDLVDGARVYLNSSFTGPVTLAEVGRNVGASPYHLARLFRRHTGLTVHEYVTNLRLRAALGELDGASSNISDIALSLGFSDNSHLTKTFREKFGVTPSQFRTGGAETLRTILTA